MTGGAIKLDMYLEAPTEAAFSVLGKRLQAVLEENGIDLDGSALVNLAYAYTIAINTGAVPSIQNAWNYICETKCQHALTAALKHYENTAKDLVVELPMGVDELDAAHRKMEQEAWKLFQKDAMGEGQVRVPVCLYTHIPWDAVGVYV